MNHEQRRLRQQCPSIVLRRMQAKLRGRDHTIRRIDGKMNRMYQRIASVRIAAREAERRWKAVLVETANLRALVAELESQVDSERQRAESLWCEVTKGGSVN